MSSQRQSEIVTADQPDRWMEILEEVGEYDFYHLPAYQRLAETRVEGRAVLPVFRYGGCTMAFPLLIREIDIPGVRSDGYRDAACVPGLTGPVISPSSCTEDLRHGLMRQFQDFLEENRIVSVYSRLHFLMGQEEILAGYGDLRKEGMEVTVDLTVPPEERFSSYIRNHRRDISKLRSRGIVCERVGSEYLDQFVSFHYATMDRVGASERYYCGKPFFEYLLNEMGEHSYLFACRDGQTIACAAIFLVCGRRVHAYRIGTMECYRPMGVSKLLYDEVMTWGHREGMRIFEFGGGNESLCRFKLGFCGTEHDYCTWRYVADPQVYDDLCRQACALGGTMPQDGYFPEYRSPSLRLKQEAR